MCRSEGETSRLNVGELKCNYRAITEGGWLGGAGEIIQFFWSVNLISISAAHQAFPSSFKMPEDWKHAWCFFVFNTTFLTSESSAPPNLKLLLVQSTICRTTFFAPPLSLCTAFHHSCNSPASEKPLRLYSSVSPNGRLSMATAVSEHLSFIRCLRLCI